MQMNEAFDIEMMTKLTRYTLGTGSFDDDNNWVEGAIEASKIMGVVTSGNRFSQFDEGISLHAEDGGARFSNYRSLYVPKRFTLAIEDKVKFGNKYYNVLQESDELVFGFQSFLLETTKNWSPA
jgi:hypothetical protein